MNCEQMNDLLWAFLDGELTAQEEEQMHAHLEQCADCRALLEQLQTLRTSFSDLEEIPAPENFAQGVMSRIKAEQKPKVTPLFKRPQLRAVMGLAACAVLCIGFGRVALNGGMKSASAEPAAAPAPECAAYDVQEYVVKQTTDGMMEARIEEAPMEYAAPIAPTAAPKIPMAETENAQKQTEPVMTPAGVEMDVCTTESEELQGELMLSLLPEEVEAVIGALEWEERAEDGALCALLTPNQAEKVMELAHNRGASLEIGQPAGGEPDVWRLVLLP